jgi:hypothetical protein
MSNRKKGTFRDIVTFVRVPVDCFVPLQKLENPFLGPANDSLTLGSGRLVGSPPAVP